MATIAASSLIQAFFLDTVLVVPSAHGSALFAQGVFTYYTSTAPR